MKTESKLQSIFAEWITPASAYLVLLYCLTYPALLSFNTALLGDSGDGLQNLWNLWWLDFSLRELGQNPLYTKYLHYPQGSSLLGHPLGLFNALLVVPLGGSLPLFQIYNLIFVCGFVLTGQFTFLLARELGLERMAAFAAGCLCTFSSYHFTHAQGHLELVAFEFFPLTLWFFLRMKSSESLLHACGAALSLFALTLTSFYYGFCAALVLGVLLLNDWAVWTRSGSKQGISRSKLLFLLLCALPGAVYLFLFLETRSDPFQGAHDPLQGSLDLLGVFVPGNFWRFSAWTRGIWQNFGTYPYEASVAFGFSMFVMIFYGFRVKLQRRYPWMTLFRLLFLVALLLSLGPVLHIGGALQEKVPMLYGLFAWLTGFSKFSGLPVRLVCIAVLSGALLSAVSLQHLAARGRGGKFAAYLFFGLAIFEALPAPLPLSNPLAEKYVYFLSAQKIEGGVIDLFAKSAQAQFFQMTHRKRLAFGYTARVSKSVAKQNREIKRAIKAGDAARLCNDFYFQLIVEPRGRERFATPRAAYQDNLVSIYPLCEKQNSRS